MKTTIEKYYSNNELLMEFNRLDDKQTVSVLYDALDYMEQYNGRSKFTCIMMAMGYQNTDGESDMWTKK
jgi:hypothetical protein